MTEIKKIDDLKTLLGNNNHAVTFELQAVVIFGETHLFAKTTVEHSPKVAEHKREATDSRCHKCGRRDETCYCTN